MNVKFLIRGLNLFLYFLYFYNRLTQHNKSQMQILQLRLKRLIQWIITKKQSIHSLITNHLPIYRAIKQFIQTYIQNMNEIADISQKIMKDMNRIANKDTINKTLYGLFDLIRTKELLGVEQWTEKLDILEAKYQIGDNATKAKDNRKFPDIFKDIDTNVQYYTQLKMKIQKLIQKQKGNPRQIPQKNLVAPQINKDYRKLITEQKQLKNRKTDDYASMYDKIYGKAKLINADKIIGKKQHNYVTNANKTYDYASYNSAQLSPFRLVNPKYSPYKYQNKDIKIRNATQSTQLYRTGFDQLVPQIPNKKYQKYQKQKYRQFKADLFKQLYTIPPEVPKTPKSLKYTADNYLTNGSPIRTNNYKQLRQYSTTSTQKNKQISNKYYNNKQLLFKYDNNQQQIPKTIKQTQTNKPIRKYQYLFDNKQQQEQYVKYNKINTTKNQLNRKIQTKQINKPKSKSKQKILQVPKYKPQNINNYNTQKYERYNKNDLFGDKKLNNNDSLEIQHQRDYLGRQLEIQMPVLFRDDHEGSLQQILTSSLLSSKKWNDLEHGQNNENKIKNYSIQDEDSEISVPDSLDESNQAIRQTGKFKQLQYTDQDQDEKQTQQKISKPIISKFDPTKPLTIQKQVSSQSKDLNMSFGKN